MIPVAGSPMTKPRVNPPKTVSAARRPRCVVVEDHQMFGDLLAISFAAAPDMAVDIVEITPSVAAGIAACDRHKPDVVLLDLKLPDGPGNAVAEHVAATLPETRVIVVSGQSSTFVCPPELASCIDGVVNKADAFHALQVILAGLFQPADGGKGGSLPQGRRLTTILTRREREGLALIGQRLSSREIAERIGVSLHTINAHRKNIARKLGIRGTHLALVAYEYRSQLDRRS